MNKICMIAMVAGAGLLGVQSANAEAFKSSKDCVAGKRVADNGGKTGKVIGAPNGDPTGCNVLWDSDGKSHYYIFWMLHAEGGSAETNDKLVPGKYECFAGGRYTFMDMYITGPNTYDASGTGKFRVEPSKKIVFETGPLVKANAKLLAGPSIGLNLNGDSFYSTTCELKKR